MTSAGSVFDLLIVELPQGDDVATGRVVAQVVRFPRFAQPHGRLLGRKHPRREENRQNAEDTEGQDAVFWFTDHSAASCIACLVAGTPSQRSFFPY